MTERLDPDRLTGTEARRLLGFKPAFFYKWQRLGKFRRYLHPAPVGRRIYSRKRILATEEKAS